RSWLRGQTLFEQVEQALLGGVTLVQLREKELDEASFLREAVDMTKLCHRYGVPLLINDNVEIARRSGADGVHVGQDDMEAAAVRSVLGSGMIVGVTAKTVQQALRAQEAGADYLGSGAVFGSSTKLNAKPMTTDLLRSICRAVSIPVVAIGGINRSNLSALAGTDISGVAVVSGIFAASDIRAECRHLRSIVRQIIP
ncbi:MAG: thiamine phosphate synthase, partial [Clostridia bacterium]|nr:thiamine phosphate synthase [Clostridia bacterium]